MQNFYTHKDNFTGDTVILTGDEHYHATRSARIKIGQVIGVTDGCGRKVEARITGINSRSLTAEIEHDVSGTGEPQCKLTVALSLIKPSRFEIAVEKCTELGARVFMPLVTKRCTFTPKRFNFERLKKIAREAAKQSGRSWIPEITKPITITELFSQVKSDTFIALQPSETSFDMIRNIIKGKRDISLIIGPEGDFTDEELYYLLRGGAMTLSLGELTLRSETAAIAATSLIVSALTNK